MTVIELPARELAGLCARGPRPVLLDVREPWEVSTARAAPDGVDLATIPMGEIVRRVGELDPARPTVCLCHHGMRSLQVARFLASRGFDPVYNLSGGIDAWSTQVDPGVPRY